MLEAGEGSGSGSHGLERRWYFGAMEINLVVLNVGNTRIACGTFVAGELRGVTRHRIDDRSAWQKAIVDAWASLDGRDAAVVAATVNPPLTESLEHVVDLAIGRDNRLGREEPGFADQSVDGEAR